MKWNLLNSVMNFVNTAFTAKSETRRMECGSVSSGILVAVLWRAATVQKILMLLCVVLIMPSCTVVYGPDGKPRLRSGDVQHIAYTHAADGSESLVADGLMPSTVITAAGKAATPAVMAVGGAVMMNGTTKVVDAVRKPVP